MFGTNYKNNSNKKVLIETKYLEKLTMNVIPCNAYCIIVLTNGRIPAKINDNSCYFEAPTLICLDELKKMELVSNCKAEAKLIIFNPEFLMLKQTQLILKTIKTDTFYLRPVNRMQPLSISIL